MKKPLPTRVLMKEPTKPVCSVTKSVYREVPVTSTLQEAVDELFALGISLDRVTIGEQSDRWGEHECYTLDWTNHEVETQPDAQWAKTCAQYEADMAEYAKQKTLYEVAHAEYLAKLAEYESWLAAEERRKDIEALKALLVKYPDHNEAASRP